MKTMSSAPCTMFRSSSRRAFGNAIVISGFVAVMVALPALADDLSDVTKEVRSGQYADALVKADAFLNKHPRDAQMRFLKGVILTEQNKSSEAITVFTKLTEDFPELPEPYNNLAVLYAASGQYEKARIALDAAIRTNPAYATAYENLGDVHAKLASLAYDKALQLDSGNSAAKSKLTLLRNMAGNGGAASKMPNVASAASVTAPTVVAAKTVAAEPVKQTSVASVTSSTLSSKAEVKQESKPPKQVAEGNETGEILSAVHAWARAWSDQDVKAYLNYYASDFVPPKGESRSAWAEERHQRIEGKDHIDVKVDSPQVSVNGNTATVKFRQIYVSNRLKADSRKVLILTRQGGKWQIKQERAGS